MSHRILDRDQVEHIAKLARLRLTEDEKDLMAEQLSSILDYVAKLNESDTTDVDPMHHAVDRSNVFRDDNPHKSIDHNEALANAPQTDGTFFIVPRVI